MVAPRQQSTLALIDELLAEQQQLHTPVARYSRVHDTEPALAPVYRDLIPLSAPADGEQYAFEVDLDSCSGCKACVAGCHSLNGLDETETWRDVGTVIGGSVAQPYQQTITTSCHHCADPACLNGCPVLAYEKDPVTGIVRHLDDQCIGCSYCILKCPYDVPKYSQRLGIVRKCDMCHGRLAAGEAPACVQACPTHAIRIVTVSTAKDASYHVDTAAFLPGAPDPARTQPTTRYVSKRPIPANLQTAVASDSVQPAHTPLGLMFLGTQLAVGLQCGFVMSGHSSNASSTLALGVAGLGLAASIFHLGRPLRAWRVFLGLRRSWLSREAVVFGAWFKIGLLALLLPRLSLSPLIPSTVGLLGIFCSAMIYIDTGRVAWRPLPTFVRFFGTVAIGAALALFDPLLLAMAAGSKVALELVPLPGNERRRHQMLNGPLHRLYRARWFFAGFGVLLCSATHLEPAAWWCGVFCLMLGESFEKRLFFRAVESSRMPGIASP